MEVDKKVKIKKFAKMKKNCIKKTMNDKGQSTFEFVLILPFLLLTFLIVSQLGIILYIQNNLTQISRETVRIISTTNSNRQACHLADNNSFLKKHYYKMQINPPYSNERQTGDIVSVNLSIKYKGFANIISHFIGEDLEISAKSAMRMECQ